MPRHFKEDIHLLGICVMMWKEKLIVSMSSCEHCKKIVK
jgi:hypothetical protein